MRSERRVGIGLIELFFLKVSLIIVLLLISQTSLCQTKTNSNKFKRQTLKVNTSSTYSRSLTSVDYISFLLDEMME